MRSIDYETQVDEEKLKAKGRAGPGKEKLNAANDVMLSLQQLVQMLDISFQLALHQSFKLSVGDSPMIGTVDCIATGRTLSAMK